LTLHGVTQPQQITAQVSVTGNQLSASGEFTVRQSSYGIKPVSVAGGTMKIKDDVKVTFDLVARKKE
jgi:polyisoprenoid-binding protein YceI